MNFERHDRKKIENKERKKFAKGFGPLSSQSDIPSRLLALSISKTDIRKSGFQNGKEFVSQLSGPVYSFPTDSIPFDSFAKSCLLMICSRV